MADFELLAPGGHQELVDEVLDRLDTKADYDGYYAQLTAGAADNLTARGDAVDAEFMRRTSGGSADIESGHATIESIKGNAVVWGQYAQTWTGTTRGVTFTGTDGLQTISGTATDNATSRITTTAVTIGHKYLVKLGGLRFGSGNTATLRAVRDYSAAGNLTAEKNARIIDTSNSVWVEGNVLGIQVVANTGTVADTSFYPQIFDLTRMFGAGNEPETVAEFEAMYPEPYYEYDAGSLKPVKLNGIETTGFNQWDEEWEVGAIAVATGQNVTDSNAIRSKDYNSCFPNTDYYIKGTNPVYVFWYDAGKNYISNTYTVNNVRQSPANAAYFRVRVDGTNTYNNDITINLSWSGRRNGEYEAYWKSERLIALGTHFPTGLKRAGSVYDELTADEAIQRVGEVDLGTLTWTPEAAWQQPKGLTRLWATVSDAVTGGSENIIASGYFETNLTVVVSTMSTAYCIAMYSGRVYVTMPYPEINTASDFATWLTSHPTTLYYELATPVTTPIDPALNLTYKVDDWGTEQVIVPSATVSAEPKFSIVYGMNAVDTIRRLPTLYAGKDATEQALDHKADVDGYYAQMTVGAADSLTGRGDGVSASYLYRTTGGDADVADGTATVKSIHGRTVVWNQLFRLTNGSATKWGLTSTSSAEDGTITVSGTSEDRGSLTAFPIPNVKDHKYLIKSNSSDVSKAYISSQSYGADTSGNGIIITNTADAATWYYTLYIPASGVTYSNVTVRPQLFDLTAMFGAGNEPSTVAEFEALYPEPYYPYDAGSLLSVQMEGIETVGFNQLAGMQKGNINTETGALTNDSSGNRWRSTEAIDAFPETAYYLKLPDGVTNASMTYRMFCYDGSGGFIGYVEGVGVKTTLAGTRFIRLYAYSTAALSDFPSGACINLSWSGYRNGEYEPYWTQQRTIPATDLRSAGTVYDELTSDEAVTRVGAVDLGTLGWEKYDVSGVAAFRSYGLPDLAPATSTSVAGNVKSAEYDAYGSGELTSHDKGVAVSVGAHVLYLRNSAFDSMTAAEAKAALSGVILYYALATPTVTPIDPPLNLSYRVSDFGTERIMVPVNEQSAAPTQQVVYGLNVVDTVRRLPTEYISHDSFTQFINALATSLGATIAESWDATDGRYEYTITQNGE